MTPRQEPYRLTLSGIGRTETRGQLSLVAQEARNWAMRGYVPCIHNQQGSVVEVRRVADGFVLSWHPSGQGPSSANASDSSEPAWMEVLRGLLSETKQGEWP